MVCHIVSHTRSCRNIIVIINLLVLMAFCLAQMWSRPVNFLWLWAVTDREPQCQHVPVNKIWNWTESGPQSGRWCSHTAGIHSDCSTREIITYDADKNTDLDMSKSRQRNGSDSSDKAAAAAPMSQISGVRRLQQSNSVVGIVPRFGVDIPNEQPLAEVSHTIVMSELSNNRPLTGWRCGVVVSGVRHMNEVNARRARLLPRWVTVFGRVYHLGM